MRSLPLADPGTPDVRSPGRYLWWVARGQLPTIIGGITFGTIWMVAQSVMPAIIGKAIDAGVADQNMSQLWLWALALLGVGVAGAREIALDLADAVAKLAQARFEPVAEGVVASHGSPSRLA